ncbi:uncharacterized protein LOC143284284 [Babylonia areolata]|uniref:uncharacterized protein LOC143284284 n=1 Tax=Babylonia areolata TaxID=304850 RepID=UPI003FD632CE
MRPCQGQTMCTPTAELPPSAHHPSTRGHCGTRHGAHGSWNTRCQTPLPPHSQGASPSAWKSSHCHHKTPGHGDWGRPDVRPGEVMPGHPVPFRGGYPPFRGDYPPSRGDYPPFRDAHPSVQGGHPSFHGGYPPFHGHRPGFYGGRGFQGGPEHSRFFREFDFQ